MLAELAKGMLGDGCMGDDGGGIWTDAGCAGGTACCAGRGSAGGRGGTVKRAQVGKAITNSAHAAGPPAGNATWACIATAEASACSCGSVAPCRYVR